MEVSRDKNLFSIKTTLGVCLHGVSIGGGGQVGVRLRSRPNVDNRTGRAMLHLLGKQR